MQTLIDFNPYPSLKKISMIWKLLQHFIYYNNFGNKQIRRNMNFSKLRNYEKLSSNPPRRASNNKKL